MKPSYKPNSSSTSKDQTHDLESSESHKDGGPILRMRLLVLAGSLTFVMMGILIVQTFHSICNSNLVVGIDVGLNVSAVLNVLSPPSWDVKIEHTGLYPGPMHAKPDHGTIARADPPTDEDLFQDCACKGDRFLKMMKLTDAKAGQLMPKPMDSIESSFLDYADLKKWGWDWVPFDTWDFKSYDIVEALKGLGLDPKKTSDGGRFFGQHYEHDLGEVEINGKKYPPTHGMYITLFDKEDGFILGLSKYSPSHMGPLQHPPVNVFPDLQRWSDIAFLQWQQLMGNNVGNVKYIMSWSIDNPACKTVMKKAFEKTGAVLAPWPGVTYGMDSEEGKALLGCPNGVGIGWFLVQHKKQLGNTIVEKIVVFQDGTKEKKPGFIYFIKDEPTADNVD
ncbi:hypothetical protein EJ04DRAFT_562469 [Polyplosphaeria fusca]|uniref:Uncharacterized protein n=1 Tax=Polyplosphaeria fusca TaxID=682080 RepID=A0A9P4R4P7_9PLEO|nr:hypothetical protein EJ04DRAFT_562469 [Polyplosphaeria fusca]